MRATLSPKTKPPAASVGPSVPSVPANSPQTPGRIFERQGRGQGHFLVAAAFSQAPDGHCGFPSGQQAERLVAWKQGRSPVQSFFCQFRGFEPGFADEPIRQNARRVPQKFCGARGGVQCLSVGGRQNILHPLEQRIAGFGRFPGTSGQPLCSR